MASTALAPHGPSLQQHLVDDWQWRVPAAWQQQDMPKASHALPGVQPGQLGGIGREPLVGGGSRAAAARHPAFFVGYEACIAMPQRPVGVDAALHACTKPFSCRGTWAPNA